MQFAMLFIVFILSPFSRHVIGKPATIILTLIATLVFLAGLFGWVSYPMMNRQYSDQEIFTFLGYVTVLGVIIPGAISFYIIRSASGSGIKGFFGSILVVLYLNLTWLGFAFTQMVHST